MKMKDVVDKVKRKKSHESKGDEVAPTGNYNNGRVTFFRAW